MGVRQTGGDKRAWLFSNDEVENIPAIQNQLIHHDKYFEEEDETENTLAIILDKILADLPDDIADCVRLVYLEGHSYRLCSRMLGIDHKTVKARAERGIEHLRERLLDSIWMSEMLRGYIPEDEIRTQPAATPAAISHILRTLGSNVD
jgi:DNA-directed RNA polymerase specialized sigma24 family protein